MTTDYILDLGENGTVVIVSQETLPQEEEGIVEAGLGDTIREGVTVVVDSAAELITYPLRGVVKLLARSIPDDKPEDTHQLDEFTVEFEISLESGASLGPILKITPKGSFKCTYKWSRKGADDK